MQSHQIAYKHFLTYNQEMELQIEYGYTDLFYTIAESTLYIKKVDRSNKSELEFEFPITKYAGSIESILEDFLVKYMSDTFKFFGTPVYVNSEIFSKDLFDSMLQRSIAIIDERKAKAIEMNMDNDLIKYLQYIHKQPEPCVGSTTSWRANCPSGAQHHIAISTLTNEWGCGYCGKRGDLNALKEWVNSLKNKA